MRRVLLEFDILHVGEFSADRVEKEINDIRRDRLLRAVIYRTGASIHRQTYVQLLMRNYLFVYLLII